MKTELLKALSAQNTLFANHKDIFYITGCPFDGFWLATLGKTPTIITSKMMLAQCKGFFEPFKFAVIESAKYATALAEICKAKNINRIETSAQSITLADFNIIKDVLSAHSIMLEGTQDKLKQYRYTKTEEEINYIKEACRITSQAADEIGVELQSQSASLLTELDVHYKILEKFARKHVSESFTPIVASGPNSANPHHVSGQRVIQENDIVLIDIGCKYKGYASDLTRTFFLGKINVKYQQVFDVVFAAQKAAIGVLKAGISADLPDTAARNVIENAGYGANFIHSTGHGVGIDVHESPRLSQKSPNIEGEVLKAGCVVTVEPGIYLPEGTVSFKGFGIRIEDTVLVTPNGYEVLTNAKY